MSPTWKSRCFFSGGCAETSTESERDGVFLPRSLFPMETRILVFHRRLGDAGEATESQTGPQSAHLHF